MHHSTELNRRGRKIRSEDGAAMVEFSIVVILLLALVYGIVTYGVVFWLKSTVTQAAAEGARSAIRVPVAEAEAQALARAEEIINETLPEDYRDTAEVEVSSGGCPDDASIDCLTVTVTYDYDADPVLPPAPLLGILVPEQISSTSIIELTS